MKLSNLLLTLKARGNWGHGGRPGKRGGSTPSSKGAFSSVKGSDLKTGDIVRQVEKGKELDMGRIINSDATHIEVKWDKYGTHRYPRNAVNTPSLPGIERKA